MRFVEILEQLGQAGVGAEQAKVAQQRFRDLAIANGFHVRNTPESMPTYNRIVIGLAASYAPTELAAFDQAVEHLSICKEDIELIDVSACTSPSELSQYLPGLPYVIQSPFVAVWNGLEWVALITGHKAIELLRAGLKGLWKDRQD
jgi:hypothetical protein